VSIIHLTHTIIFIYLFKEKESFREHFINAQWNNYNKAWRKLSFHLFDILAVLYALSIGSFACYYLFPSLKITGLRSYKSLAHDWLECLFAAWRGKTKSSPSN
jgi:hypothetical protein